MLFFFSAWTAAYIFSQGLAVVLLLLAQHNARRRQRRLPALSNYPGVSIITSLKGPTPAARESVRSLLEQDYPGPIEIIFATLDDKEPLIADVKDVINKVPNSAKTTAVRWVYPVDATGLNPRTAKIARAYEASQHPWIFMVCVDTRFSASYLRRAMELTELNCKRYVTSFPVIDSPQDFFAKLEAIGLNVDVSQFFLMSTFNEKAACAYGGAFLYSRSLMEEAGGYQPLLPLLTDDITLANAFREQGGLCLLTQDFAYVRQERHSFKSFWSRQVRWRMIGKFFTKSLFWLAPLSWLPLYLIMLGLIRAELSFFFLVIPIWITRILVASFVQTILQTPNRDRLAVWALPIYDLISIPAWTSALFRNTIAWGPTVMRLDKKGAIIQTESELEKRVSTSSEPPSQCGADTLAQTESDDQFTPTIGLRSVAVFEAVKGLLVLAAGLGLLHLLHKDLQLEGENWLRFLHMNPEHHYEQLFLQAMGRIKQKNLIWFALGALAYCIVRLIEAYGLWHRRIWAEWFAILSGSMYLPVEFYELFRHFSKFKVGLVVLNIVIVAYLLHSRLQARGYEPR